jgi:ATP-binding cassette, subfamily B, bacterial PglK
LTQNQQKHLDSFSTRHYSLINLSLLQKIYHNILLYHSLNGIPLNDDSIIKWQHNVAYLPQDVFLIDDSLRNNAALGIEESEICNEHLSKALHKARLMELVAQLPSGANTLVGERGVRFSGGKRKRVGLARAFYHERNVLVMDEATSALDNETEREIVEEIKQFKGKITMIVIAHRLTTV